MTREAREDWGIDDAAGDAAALIVSEPATNAVVHAGTASRVTVELTDRPGGQLP
jgi:anti-sigma regulatory factor (Ser/Thr protein kinase)